jgi:UDP-N-acetyl-2-amino-2-deoxyglucuronate dehydrogenase
MVVHVNSHDRAAGYMELEKARVRWFLSINEDCLPKQALEQGKRTYRSIQIEGEELEFSEGFTDLHTQSYNHILSGGGFRISETKTAIQIVHNIRHSAPIGLVGDYHPLAALPLSKHPFNK